MSEAWFDRVSRVANRRDALLNQLGQTPSGLAWCAEHTDLVDEAVRAVYEANPPPGVAIVATGGYGRRELAPWSDVDLAVVPSAENAPGLDSAVRQFFQGIHVALQDVLGLEVGYSYRLVADCSALDVKSRTGLMDARLVCGEVNALGLLQEELADTLPVGEFVLHKLRERDAAYLKHHDTPLVVEAHLKEGSGGLRDYHTACWIADAIGLERPRATAAYDHVLAVRNALHKVAESRTDRFTRGRQAEVADLWCSDMLSVVSELCRSMLEIAEVVEQARSQIRSTSYRLSDGMRAERGIASPEPGATPSQAAVGVSLSAKLGLSCPKFDLPSIETYNGPEILFALAAGEETVRSLDRTGLLELLLPELVVCRTLMPNDTAHQYTVYEHTMRVLRNLDSLQPGSFLGNVLAGLPSRGGLYLGALLHDAGKADPTRRHSESGADLARAVCRRWRLAEDLSGDVEWLVRHHLTLAEFLRLRDVDNPATAEELAALVGKPERLDMLAVLTWADVAAVYPGAWSAAQDELLENLYRRTRRVLEVGEGATSDPAVYRKKLLRDLRTVDVPADEIASFVESLPAHYLISTPPELVRLHIELERRARQAPATVELFDQAEIGRTEVTICCLDTPGLLSSLLGTIYSFDLSIHGLRASTTQTDSPVALDVFTVSFAGRPIPTATAQAFSEAARQVIGGEVRVADLLRAHGKDPLRPQEMFSHRFLPGRPGILEIQAPTGRGMPYRMSKLVSDHGWNIVAARFGQWAGRATAAFYIAGEGGRDLAEAEVEKALASK